MTCPAYAGCRISADAQTASVLHHFSISPSLSPAVAMVVLHTQASTSEVKHKKNRRKMAKKPARTVPAEGAEGAAEDSEDLEMDEQPSAEAAAENTTEPPPETNWNDGDDEVMIDADTATPPQTDAPAFPPLPASAQRSALKSEIRRIPIPPHRMTPLKKDWVNIFSPLTEILQLQVRMNIQRKCVEIRVSFSLIWGPRMAH